MNIRAHGLPACL